MAFKDNTDREKAYQYAKLYHLTNRFTTYKDEVVKKFGMEYLHEAVIAWEAIDQYVGQFQHR